MKIRKVDSKNRVTVTAKDGVIYSESVAEDGTITLHPIKVPKPTRGDGDTLRAVYVNMSSTRSAADTITIHSNMGGTDALAKFVVDFATEHMIPIVVNTYGLGCDLADNLASKYGFEGQVIEKTLLSVDDDHWNV